MDEIYQQRDGARLFAAAVGPADGRAIVFLHGGLADHRSALHFVGSLATRFRVLAPDLRASGRSHHAGPIRWRQLADDVAAIARHAGIERAAIAGASFGAGTAAAVALAHPELASALALFMPAFGGADLGLTPAQAAAMAAMADAGGRAPADGIAAIFPLFDALPEAVRARARAMASEYDPASVAALTRFMNSGAQPFATAAELAAIAAPTLVVPGADPTHPPEVAARIAAHLRQPTVRAATPDQYAAVLAAFLDEHAG